MPSLLLEIGASIARLHSDLAKAQNTISGFAKTAQSVFAGLGIGLSTAAIGSFLTSAAKMGIAAKQSEESFRSMATGVNESADDVIKAMDKAAAGTIDNSDLMQKAVKGMAAGMTGKELEQVSQAARATARVIGKDVSETFERIVDAISTETPKALKQMTLITKEQMTMFNKAVASGAEEVSLLDIVLANAAEQQKKMGPIVANEAEEVQKLNAQWNDFKESIGIGTVKAIMGTVNALRESSSAISQNIEYMIQGGPPIEDMIDNMNDLADAAKKVKEAIPKEGWFDYGTGKGALETPKKLDEGIWQESDIYGSKIKSGVQIWEERAKAAIAAKEKEKEAAKGQIDLMKEIDRESEKAQASLFDVSSAEQKVTDQMSKNRLAADELSKNHLRSVMDDLQAEADAHLQASQAHQEVQVAQRLAEVEIAEKSSDRLVELTEHAAEQMEENFSDLFFNVMTGKFEDLGDFATGIFESIARAASDYLGQIATDFMFGEGQKSGRSGGMLSGLFGLFSGGGSGMSTGMAVGMDALSALAMIHGGGQVGRDSFPAKWITAGAFAGAPRLHGGLASDEYPAILQKGETVIPKGGEGQAQQSPPLNIMINAVDSASFAQMAARNPSAITGPIMEALQKGGQLRNMIRGVI